MNSEYFHIAQPGEQADGKYAMTKEQAKNFVNYVATREGVSLNFNPLGLTGEEAGREATIRQERTIDGLLREVPAAKDTFEYEDYLKHPTVGNASELISRAAEMGFGQTGTEKTIGADEARNFVEYVAKRPGAVREGAHGLFSSSPNLDLDKVADEVASYTGRIWRNVISIRREDADKLEYDTQRPWKQAVEQQIDNIAESFHILPEHLRWYAGMHNTGHHPHIHLFVFSTDPKEGRLDQTGIQNIKRGFSNIIFADERLHIYQEKDQYRDKLKMRADELLASLEHSGCPFSKEKANDIYSRLLKLGGSVRKVSGRHFYKFIPKDLKEQTDQILLQLSSAPDIQKLYRLYCEQQRALDRMYVNDPKTVPLPENKDFYMLKNKIIQSAEKLADAVMGSEGEDAPEEIDMPDGSPDDGGDETNPEPADPVCPFPDAECPNDRENQYPEQIKEDSQAHFTETSPEKILNLIDRAAGPAGDQNARYELGKRYLCGGGVKRSGEQARMWFGLAAAQGHFLAEYQLGRMYLYGNGIDKDPKQGREFCLSAYEDILYELQEKTGAELRNGIYYPSGRFTVKSYYSYLEYLIGKMRLSGEGVQQDDTQAFRWFQASGIHGFVHGDYMTARMYYEGKGVGQDYDEALYQYEKAARSNDKYACYAAGRMYYLGIGTKQNFKKAAVYFAKASQKNVPWADYALAQMCEAGQCVRKNKEAAQALYKKTLEEFQEQEKRSPDPMTQFRIAEMYFTGQGTEADPGKAAEWFQKAVDSGNPQAAYELAKLYSSGNGVEADAEKAQSLYQAALKGFLDSEKSRPAVWREYRIAGMYEKGLGTDVNVQKAIRWYKTAADNGDGHAAYHLGHIYQDGQIAEQDFSAALKWFEKAADLGNKYAWYSLGCLYCDGKGIRQNFSKAAEWFQKAVDSGNPQAAYELAKLYSSGNGVEADAEKAQSLYQAALKGFLDSEKSRPAVWRKYRIAGMYEKGLGTDVNVQEAIRWYKTAADKGHGNAQYRLSLLYGEKQPLAANRYFRMALQTFIREESLSPDAGREYRIAKMLVQLDAAQQGGASFTQAAVSWYEKSAGLGDCRAAYELAKILEHRITGRDGYERMQRYYEMALKGFLRLYRAAGASDRERFALAKRIGEMYLHGDGTPVLETEAFRWFRKAAESGNPSVQYRLGKMYLHGTGCAQDPCMAFRCFYRSAAAGNQYAQYQTGRMYENGSGTEKNNAKAEQWFRTAAENGNQAAQSRLDYRHNQEKYAAFSVVSSLLRMMGGAVGGQIEDSTTRRFGMDRKALRKRRRQKSALGQKDDELDEVL